MALILITGGFWLIQGQIYASMPKYVIRLLGPGASPEWLSNVNSALVILLVIPITHLVRRMSATASIGLALVLMPLSALLMAWASLLPNPVNILGAAANPLTVMMILGIALTGVAECFLSPKYLEFASKQAPPGQEGLYLGYSHLSVFFAWFFGFMASGYLLDAFCPDPKKLGIARPAEMPQAYAHAHPSRAPPVRRRHAPHRRAPGEGIETAKQRDSETAMGPFPPCFPDSLSP
jgi:dipeptide/tripeptide permease